MRVMHIIPSAFEYFKDIKAEAFAIADEIENVSKEDVVPVETGMMTIQYTAPTAVERKEMEHVAPKMEYTGETAPAAVVNQFADYDIVHLHCPFMGSGGLIKKWKEENPGQPLVVTYYRDVIMSDLFCYVFKFYNAYFLPKIFSLADVVTCFNYEDFNKSLGSKYLKDKNKLVPLLTDADMLKLDKREYVAIKFHEIYKLLLA